MAGSKEETKFEKKPLHDIRLKVFKNVCIQGNSDIVVDVENGLVVSEEAYYVGENVEIIDGLLYRTRNNICMLRDNLCHRKKRIHSGIMISGKFCNNYYHLLYENFNKLIYLEQMNIPNDVPFIIDRITMEIPSCKRIFEILTNNVNRPIITIESDILYQFDMLYCLDHVNILPPHIKDPHKPSAVFYSPEALKCLCNKLLPYRSMQLFANRFFISRVNTNRRHFNEKDVYGVLEKYGFSQIAPEQYSFEEQMALFNGARYIVSSSGAALSNLLFVPKDCIVICFGRSNEREVCESAIFNTIANLKGAYFFFFPRKGVVGNNIHIDFEIDCAELEKRLTTIID